MTIRERIKHFCANQFITVSEFEKRSGLSNGYVRQIKSRIGNEKLQSIHDAFPNLSIDWLVLEHGNMINSPSSSKDNKENQFQTSSYNNTDKCNESYNNIIPISEKQYLDQLEWFKRELDKRDSQFDRLLTLFERVTIQDISSQNLDTRNKPESRQKQ